MFQVLRWFKLLEIQSLWTQSYQQPHTVSACIQLNSFGNMGLPGRKPVPFWNYGKNSTLMNSHDWQCMSKLKSLVSHNRRGVELVMPMSLYFHTNSTKIVLQSTQWPNWCETVCFCFWFVFPRMMSVNLLTETDQKQEQTVSRSTMTGVQVLLDVFDWW